MIAVLPCYSWIYDIVEAVKKGVRVPVDEINLVGGRKSGKSVSVQLLFAMLSQIADKIGLIGIRASKDGGKEFFNDFAETLGYTNIKYSANFSRQVFKFATGNEIRIIGLNSMSKSSAKQSGLSKIGGVKYIFKYYEERYEFSTKDYQAVQEAIRGLGQDVQVITINVCNPWAKSNPYIAYCGKNLQWNTRELKEKGEQFKIVESLDPETKIVTRKLFQYTNWRVAQTVLSKSEIAEIKRTWEIDRNRAQTVDWGLPGYEWGAIYTHLLHKVGIATINPEPEYILAGMDYGWSKSALGGKTACVFGTASIYNGIDILGELIQDPAEHPLPPDKIADIVVQFYIQQMQDYCLKLNRTLPFQCKVKVDNMAVGIIMLLNQSARKFRVENWLSFYKCAKYPIVDRIDIQQAIMGANLFRTNNCIFLERDLEQAHYKEELEKREREKGTDHVLNAYEYAIENCMYAFARSLTPEKNYRWKGSIW